ncbi:hypothetical protein E4T47_09180 [Aureobasidium subglaciale]|nr:hypothetical protein E4T47_09180 [Aureobasidium subglaciale]
MPRNLPWLTNPAPAVNKSKPFTSTATTKRRKVDTSPPSSPNTLDELIRPQKTIVGRRNAQQTRSSSTSPPPAPPKEEFMRQGWDKDDGWRMVTDEFMATAQSFTAHLAHAEYKRQKALARKREQALGGADAIARPVVGGLSKEGKRKKEGELQRAAVRAVVGEGDEEEEEEPWLGTQLAGLMMSPRKRGGLQPKAVVGRSATRAAAGFDRARPLDLRGRPLEKDKSPEVKTEVKRVVRKDVKMEYVQDSTDDDLDAPTQSRTLPRPPRQPCRSASPTPSRPSNSRHSPHKPSSSTAPSSDFSSDRSTHKKCKSIDRDVSRPAPKRSAERGPSPAKIKLEPDFGFHPIPQLSQSGMSAVQRRREARLKREREEKAKIKTEPNDDLDELPTFLF